MNYFQTTYKCVCLVFVLTFYNVQSQNKLIDNKDVNNKKLGRKAEQENDIYSAIYHYENYLNKDTTDHRMMYHLANLHKKARNYHKAYQWYSKTKSIKPGKYKKIDYYAGTMLINMGAFEEAIDVLQNFRKSYRGKKDSRKYRKLARFKIEGAQMALSRDDHSQNITISPLHQSINKSHLEFSPYLINDTVLFYGSVRKMSETENKRPKKRQLYYALWQNGSWKDMGELNIPFNGKGYESGNVALSGDGQRIYFNRCNQNWQGKILCKIYLSVYRNGKWNAAKELPHPINNDNYTATQPAVGKDLRRGGDIVYFSSNRPGGKGGFDIWYTIYDARRDYWNEPRNAGSKINTRGNEITPFYSIENQSLYFSSDGWPGYGGYDIYKATGNGRRWFTFEHLEKPINTHYDDYYFSLWKDPNKGFLTSNRPGSNTMDNGYCCDDIFYFKKTVCTTVPVTGKVINKINMDIFNMLKNKFNIELRFKNDSLPARNIPINIFKADSSKDEILVRTGYTKENGQYFFNLEKDNEYRVVVKNYGFFDKVFTLKTHDKGCNDTIFMEETTIDFIPNIPLRFNIYYEHDKARLTESSKVTIDTTMLDVLYLFPQAIIELGAHTDNTGSKDYNMKLSQKRAENVVTYLINKGISPDRLVARGYGESSPIAPNMKEDGSDNPEGRKLNRRTEIKIIGQMDSFQPSD